MPSGIVPELLIALGLVILVAVAFFLAPSRRREHPLPRSPEPPAPETTTAEAPMETAEAQAPEAEAPPSPTLAAQAPAPPRPSLRDRLARSRKFLSDRLSDAFHGTPDDETWDDVEAALIQADIGVDLATTIVADLKDKAREHRVNSADEVRGLLAEELVSLFDTDADRGLIFASDGPTVWLVVGVNGTGKTTTIGKLARDLTERGRRVALAAADTFRAAADDQLAIWAERSGSEIVRHQQGADPGAVAFDAYKFSAARDLDVLIVDTAGRLHTKTPLMDELAKVRRVIEKEGHVDEALLVIDATAGQNGLTQAREFASSAGVSGVVLTKLDGTAKGGIALAIERTLGIPIKLIGVGEGIDDLEPFDPKTFVDALLA
ncbi:MAG TPA: signal recognition particle-docking protein FtsY [Actinomycetota bacterium]|nr:signal recognition particle-docking protein FtsY [Actinomycetota bacterium]